MVTVSNEYLFYLASFLWISGISEFSFFTTEHIRKPGNHGKFSQAHFLTIYLILSTLLGILHFQNTIYKVLLKVVNEHLLFNLSGFKVAFLVIKAKIVRR